MAQPMITSSTSAGSSPVARRSTSLMAAPAMSSGYVARSVPRGARPTAVRAPETITASFMLFTFLVPEWFARCEHGLDAFQGLLVVQRREKRLLLQLEHVILRDPLRGRKLAAAQDAGEVS